MMTCQRINENINQPTTRCLIQINRLQACAILYKVQMNGTYK